MTGISIRVFELHRATATVAAAVTGPRVAPAPPRAKGSLLDSGSDSTTSSTELPVGIDRCQSIQSFAEVGGMSVTVKDLTYTVATCGCPWRRRSITLLSNVTGYFEARTMTALMGPSGSGKTTLLDLLAGRKTAGRTHGEILFAGNRPTRTFLRRYTGYVEQFDTLLPSLTVEEMLTYTAELTRPRQEGTDAKRAAVEELLDKLALTDCRDVKIGNPLNKGISGGQAKRTNIGIALITNPRVLMLDEPTSGLDSFTANEVIGLVKGLTLEGLTVVAAVHSPTPYAYDQFDSLMMLVRGQLVYFGRGGSTAFDYVRSLCPKESLHGASEVEWLVELCSIADRQGRADELAAAYAASPLRAAADARVCRLVSERHLVPSAVARELAVRHATVTPWWWGLGVLLRYRTLRDLSSPWFLTFRLADKVVLALLMLSLFWGCGSRSTIDSYFNVASVLFMWCSVPVFGASIFVHTLVNERPVFVRESHDGLYRVETYLGAKMGGEVLMAAAGSALVCPVVFYGVALQGSLLLFWLITFATLCVGISIAYTIAALAPSIDVANGALAAYVATLAFAAGFSVRFDGIPTWWRWYTKMDPLSYAFTALMANHYEARDPPFIAGKTLLGFYSMAGQDARRNTAIVWAFFVACLACCWLALVTRRYSRR